MRPRQCTSRTRPQTPLVEVSVKVVNMTVLFMLLMFTAFLGIDYFKKSRVHEIRYARERACFIGMDYMTPGFAQDGGLPVDNFKGENI